MSQQKGYPRDFLDMFRVRVQIKRADGSLVREDIPNRRALLVRLAAEIKQLEERINPPEPKKIEAPTSGNGKPATGGASASAAGHQVLVYF